MERWSDFWANLKIHAEGWMPHPDRFSRESLAALLLPQIYLPAGRFVDMWGMCGREGSRMKSRWEACRLTGSWRRGWHPLVFRDSGNQSLTPTLSNMTGIWTDEAQVARLWLRLLSCFESICAWTAWSLVLDKWIKQLISGAFFHVATSLCSSTCTRVREEDRRHSGRAEVYTLHHSVDAQRLSEGQKPWVLVHHHFSEHLWCTKFVSARQLGFLQRGKHLTKPRD